jgi:hypothetical protein
MWSTRPPLGNPTRWGTDQRERPKVTSAHVEYVAHHWLLLAGPAFLPAVIVVAVILYIAIKDRRTPADDEQTPAADTADKKRD